TRPSKRRLADTPGTSTRLVSLASARFVQNGPHAPDTEQGSSAKQAAQAEPKQEAQLARAEIGKAAPDFSLQDLEGKQVRLADFKGKTVVLEWFNPGCPFVKLSHTEGSLKGLAKERSKAGVVWLAINSGAEGRQGASV